MKYFIRYSLSWISQNLSIPFWIVGHIHLTMNVYEDIYEILMSVGMNIIVGVGFFLDFLDYKKDKINDKKKGY
jgi:hypothetical protein